MRISPGDLVIVVKPSSCCGDTGELGKIFVAGDTLIADGVCGKCWTQLFTQRYVSVSDSSGTLWIDECRLRRIPPMSQLQYMREAKVKHG